MRCGLDDFYKNFIFSFIIRIMTLKGNFLLKLPVEFCLIEIFPNCFWFKFCNSGVWDDSLLPVTECRGAGRRVETDLISHFPSSDGNTLPLPVIIRNRVTESRKQTQSHKGRFYRVSLNYLMNMNYILISGIKRRLPLASSFLKRS